MLVLKKNKIINPMKYDRPLFAFYTVNCTRLITHSLATLTLCGLFQRFNRPVSEKNGKARSIWFILIIKYEILQAYERKNQIYDEILLLITIRSVLNAAFHHALRHTSMSI